MMGSMGEMMGFGWWGGAMWVNLLLGVGLLALVTIDIVAGTGGSRGAARVSGAGV